MNTGTKTLKHLPLLLLIVAVISLLSSAATDYSNDANIVGYWNMDGSADANETEQSGNGSTLDQNGGIAASVDFKFGTGSRDLEASSSEYFDQSDSLSTDVNGADQAISLVCWIKIESTAGAQRNLIAKWNTGAADRQYRLYWDDPDANEAVFALSDNGTNVTEAEGATNIAISTWYHIAAVYNDTDMRVYVNGSLDSNGASNPKTYSAGISNEPATFNVGASTSFGTATLFFDGLIDDVAVFDRALSAAEVLEIYNYGVTGEGDTASSSSILLFDIFNTGGGKTIKLGGKQ